MREASPMANEAMTLQERTPAARKISDRIPDAWLLPGSFVLLLILWEITVRAFDVPIFIVPPPSRIFVSLWSIIVSGMLFQQFLVTFTEALAGFACAVVAAAIFATLITEWRLGERVLYPYFAALQSMPKVAIAPLIVIWFGYGLGSKIAVAGLLSFFPMLISFVEGLKATDAGRLKLMRALSASRWQTLRYVRIPYALPFVFAGIELGGIYAMLGAIVAEFVGSSAGMGNWLIALNLNLDTATTFALLIVLSLYGIGFQKLIATVRRRALFWQGGGLPSTRPGSSIKR
jgi:NitT/TauT family transport system permease protein